MITGSSLKPARRFKPTRRFKILLVYTYYPEFLRELYAGDASLGRLDYHSQQRRIMESGFGLGDAYSHYLRRLGCEVDEVIVNADPLQQQWAKEHGLPCPGDIHEQRRRIMAAQIDDRRPDVLFIFEWCPLGDDFLAEVKPQVGLLVGQVASPLAKKRSYAAYDLMLSSYPPLVDHFRAEGIDAEPLKLGFDPRVLDRLHDLSPRYNVTFVGGFAPSHPDRALWLERLLKCIDIDLFGYGLETTRKDSPIRRHHGGPVWGTGMYEILQRSRITLNRHARIDVDGQVCARFANNMRLYEATGVGTCLLTEERENLKELFESGREVVTYGDETDCIEKIRFYLANEQQRQAIARAGQQRTLRDHCYAARMEQLLTLLQRRL